MPTSTSTPLDNSVLVNKCIEELSNLSLNPPVGDVVMKSCYDAYCTLLADPVIFDLTIDILQSRGFTPTHFVNIFFRAIQFIELYILKNPSYPSAFQTTEIWEKELRKIFDTHYSTLKEILLTKDTTTTIYQRYAGSKIVISAFFPNKQLRVADFGCGGNYGLPGLINNSHFEKIIDNTDRGELFRLISQQIKIIEGFAVDKENPYEESSVAWRLACSYYPHELSNSIPPHIYTDSKDTQFIQGDLTTIAHDINELIPEKHLDVIIMSTFLYQLTDAQRETVINFAKKLLNNNGVIIIQDFAQKTKDNKGLIFINNWFSAKYPYRTFILGATTNWEIKEILLWNNGRCKKAYEGVDFKFILP